MLINKHKLYRFYFVRLHITFRTYLLKLFFWNKNVFENKLIRQQIISILIFPEK